VGQLALTATVICGAGLLNQDAATGRLTMTSSAIDGLISSVMHLARYTAYSSFCPVPGNGALAPSQGRSLRL
jgi:hypothetical protein